MKNGILSFVVAGVCLLFGMANLVKAETAVVVPREFVIDAAVTASHQLISESESADGYTISLSLTIQNAGSYALSDVTLNLIDTTIPAVPGMNTYNIDFLPADSSLQIVWDISSEMSMVYQGAPIQILGYGTTSDGDTIEFNIESEGANQ